MRKASTRIHLVKYRHQIRCKEAVQVQLLGDPVHLSGGPREGVSWYWIFCRGDGTFSEVPRLNTISEGGYPWQSVRAGGGHPNDGGNT